MLGLVVYLTTKRYYQNILHNYQVRDVKPAEPSPSVLKGYGTPESVGAFYDAQTDNFVKVYGEVIQAFRTHDLSNLLNYQIEAMGLQPGMKVVDAGCGVCGPATYFAQHAGVTVDAVTVSKVQVEQGTAKVMEKGLEGKVNIHLGDYHRLPEFLPKDHYDAVYFLESFGHSSTKEKAMDAALEVLKPGGMLYIKDLFKREAVLPGHRAAMDKEIAKINTAYHYSIGDLYEVLAHLRKTGWIVAAVKTIDLPLEDFENLTISNDFQELTGIAQIDNWATYIFPVDFFEIKCFKPWYGQEKGNSRYFLQNLYYMQVHGRGEETL